MSGNVKNVDVSHIHLENILAVMSQFTFGKNVAAKIVGGERKLLQYISTGEIECRQPTNHQHGKWLCNAAQVLMHCRNMQPTRNH